MHILHDVHVSLEINNGLNTPTPTPHKKKQISTCKRTKNAEQACYCTGFPNNSLSTYKYHIKIKTIIYLII